MSVLAKILLKISNSFYIKAIKKGIFGDTKFLLVLQCNCSILKMKFIQHNIILDLFCMQSNWKKVWCNSRNRQNRLFIHAIKYFRNKDIGDKLNKLWIKSYLMLVHCNVFVFHWKYSAFDGSAINHSENLSNWNREKSLKRFWIHYIQCFS